ncbi:MAG: hypothetical protein HC892_13615 [Saprospiraceae bacterium]|nr:hypothetical protein [Saprospiraceae bacterium]
MSSTTRARRKISMKATATSKKPSKKRMSEKENTNERQVFLVGGISVAVVLIVLYLVFKSS